MELKRWGGSHFYWLHIRVLIVPSGIETVSREFSDSLQFIVLIVPSGIETDTGSFSDRDQFVLIVPSGIETYLSMHQCKYL